jgi:hypothetical protein
MKISEIMPSARNRQMLFWWREEIAHNESPAPGFRANVRELSQTYEALNRLSMICDA